ncbi:DUF6526 family protein [Granulicella arctica]|uniref:Uncharacterized protein n=1 Tax=Granulicella arctica TaxID=940613 RepID=A0A7Y9PGV7_9BACT|nr:DUF6526 family protein [Granulicella arctica]NYF79669.1 hypothetical protein [Granulicella arctica]
MPAPQSYKNHSKYDPLHHFVITPLLLLNLVFAFLFWNSDHHEHRTLSFCWIILAFTLILLSVKIRFYSLRIQDRLIRLEERLRLTALLPPAEHATIASFTTRQLIALRFASDSELPALARRTLAENLDPKQIKQAIQTWRPDYNRI